MSVKPLFLGGFWYDEDLSVKVRPPLMAHEIAFN